MEQQLKNTALLVMDMQTAILGNLSTAGVVISNVASAIAAARKNKTPVIYVTVGFRHGAPEINMNNKSFAAGKDRYLTMNMDEFVKIHPDVSPQEGEVVVTKKRYSAFTGSDLEVLLRSFGIQHIVLAGVSTSGVVLSTIREAADKDYQITILSDCCADPDEEVHRVLTTKVFPRQAQVITVAEWCKM